MNWTRGRRAIIFTGMFKHRAPGIIPPALVLSLILVTRAFAGPPYLTDDPVPTDYQHWETYLFAMGDHEDGGYIINGPAVELNYGALPDTQVSLTVSMTSVGGDTPAASGLGDVLFGVKYRFVHETNGWPQIAFYPAVTLPTGDAARGLGNGRAWFQLPLWLQKSWGPWTTYGGGGAALNSAPGARDYGFAGWLLQRDIGEHLTLGGEVFAQGRDAADDGAFLALNFGGSYQFNEHFSVLASAGHSVAGDAHTLWYFALGLDW
jgi:Putative MetA-pathway of phenol degradation